VLVDEMLMNAVVADRRRLAGRRRLVRAARSGPAYDLPTTGAGRRPRADVWDTDVWDTDVWDSAMAAFTRGAAAS
jgi:hypothetical protein